MAMQASTGTGSLDAADGELRDRMTEELRDGMTIERLKQAVEAEIEIVGFERDWWDGQAHDACLVVRRDGQRLRIVESCGETVVVPFRRRAARRSLASRRAPMRPELGLPSQRTPTPRHVIDGTADAVRCTGPRCSALREIGAVESCPRCGQPS